MYAMTLDVIASSRPRNAMMSGSVGSVFIVYARLSAFSAFLLTLTSTASDLGPRPIMLMASSFIPTASMILTIWTVLSAPGDGSILNMLDASLTPSRLPNEAQISAYLTTVLESGCSVATLSMLCMAAGSPASNCISASLRRISMSSGAALWAPSMSASAESVSPITSYDLERLTSRRTGWPPQPRAVEYSMTADLWFLVAAMQSPTTSWRPGWSGSDASIGCAIPSAPWTSPDARTRRALMNTRSGSSGSDSSARSMARMAPLRSPADSRESAMSARASGSSLACSGSSASSSSGSSLGSTATRALLLTMSGSSGCRFLIALTMLPASSSLPSSTRAAALSLRSSMLEGSAFSAGSTTDIASSGCPASRQHLASSRAISGWSLPGRLLIMDMASS